MLTVGIDAHDRFYALCILDGDGKMVKEHSIKGGPDQVADWLKGLGQPVRVCYEASLGYGTLYDRVRAVTDDVQVAHAKKLRLIYAGTRKSDRVDARKLALLRMLDRVPTIHVPALNVREWRVLIEHRRRLVDKRTAAKNGLRSILRSQAIQTPKGAKLWSRTGLRWLKEVTFASPLTTLRRDQLLLELEHFTKAIELAQEKLDQIAHAHAGVALLMTIPGVGPRTAEAVVAYVDDPHRFGSARRVGAYFGLVPCQDQSAAKNRLGHITREGPATVRKLLVEACWHVIRYSPRMRELFRRVEGGKKQRRPVALVAVARHLATAMVAMLKSGEGWRKEDPPAEEKKAA